LARSYRLLKDFEAAGNVIRSGILVLPDNHGLLNELASLAVARRDFRACIEILAPLVSKGLNEIPQDKLEMELSCVQLFVAYWQIGELDKANELLRQGVNALPDSS